VTWCGLPEHYPSRARLKRCSPRLSRPDDLEWSTGVVHDHDPDGMHCRRRQGRHRHSTRRRRGFDSHRLHQFSHWDGDHCVAATPVRVTDIGDLASLISQAAAHGTTASAWPPAAVSQHARPSNRVDRSSGPAFRLTLAVNPVPGPESRFIDEWDHLVSRRGRSVRREAGAVGDCVRVRSSPAVDSQGWRHRDRRPGLRDSRDDRPQQVPVHARDPRR
jgi:hypothetical protein